MVVEKVITWDDDSQSSSDAYYGYFYQIPEFTRIRRLGGARDCRAGYIELLETGEMEGLEGRPRAWDDCNQLMIDYEACHPELLEQIRTTGMFFGARNVGGGILDKYTKFIYLPAVKEAHEEVEGSRSAVSQLLDMIVLEQLNNRDDLVEFREQITREILDRFSHENLGSLDELSGIISVNLDRYAPGSSFILEWNPPQVPQITLPSVSCTILEDGFDSDLSRKGHGLQRAVILTLLEQLTYQRAISANEDAENPIRIDVLLLIEEPEIYLHPNRCRYFSEILEKLSEEDFRGQGARTQVVYSTHSPYFVGLERYNKIRLLRKEHLDRYPIPVTQIYDYSIEQCAEDFVRICGRTYRDALNNFRIRSIPTMNTMMNEGFFSDIVVITEGLSDIGVLWKIQEIMQKNWNQISISILSTGGKGGILKSKIIFDGFNIPTYILFDKDRSNNRENIRLLRSVEYMGTEMPDEKLHDIWAYNDLNMEDEFIHVLGIDISEEIWGEIEDLLDCDDTRIRKNPEITAKFVELVYNRGLSLPHFETIVEKIDELYHEHFG